jgi:hypothetical protein
MLVDFCFWELGYSHSDSRKWLRLWRLEWSLLGTTACTVTMTGNQTVGASFGPPDFTVTPSPSSAKVSAGGVASFNLAIAGVGGFTSAVTLSCTAPTTQGVNCSLASASTTPAAVSV